MAHKSIYGELPIFKTEKESLSYLYDIRDNGIIFRRCDSRELKPSHDRKGYLRIRLFNPQFSRNHDLRKTYKVHRLVSMMYISGYDDLMEVNHKNGDKSDNRVVNLEMVTSSQNSKHAWNVLDSRIRRKKASDFMKNRDCVSVVVKKIDTDEVVYKYKSLTETAEHWGTTKGAIYLRIKRGKMLRTPHTGARSSGRDFKGYYFAKENS